MKEATKRLELLIHEEKSKASENVKEKNMEVEQLRSQLQDREDSLVKIEANCKKAKETIEKQMKEKNELKEKVQSSETRISSNNNDLQEAKKAIEILKAELESTKKELNDKKRIEPTPANNASLNALKSLFEEKETECNKTKTELDIEKKRNSELVVTIKVLRELTGMPTTPSPSPSPSPSLSIPPNPPPLQLAPHTQVRSQNTQLQTISPANPNLASSSNLGHTQSSGGGQKRSSTTPPPLTSAPKIQRVIHVSEKASLESIAKDSSPSITSSDKEGENNISVPAKVVPLNKSISKGGSSVNQLSVDKNQTPSRNSSKSCQEAPTSTVQIQTQPATATSVPVSSSLNNESAVNAKSVSSVTSSSVGVAVSAIEGKMKRDLNNYLRIM